METIEFHYGGNFCCDYFLLSFVPPLSMLDFVSCHPPFHRKGDKSAAEQLRRQSLTHLPKKSQNRPAKTERKN